MKQNYIFQRFKPLTCRKLYKYEYMLKLANEILHKLWPSCSIQWVTALLKWHLSWDGSIFVLRCRTAPGCSLFISLATLPKFRDSRWGQRKSSISSGPICAHILPKKKRAILNNYSSSSMMLLSRHQTVQQQTPGNWLDNNLTNLPRKKNQAWEISLSSIAF